MLTRLIDLPTTTLDILIVCQDDLITSKIKSNLSTLPRVRLTVVSEAKKALHTLRSQSIDILVGNINMPGLDGWRLSRLVRSGILRCGADIPIVMVCSTWCERIAEVTAREYGVNRILPLEKIDCVYDIVKRFHYNSEIYPPNTKLLVIDDQPETAKLIKRVLGKTFDVEVITDGKNGLFAWRHEQHNLVLLSFSVAKLSCRDILIEILREKSSQAVLIMTDQASIDQAEELMLLGAVDFLPKPIRVEQLRKVCNIASLRDDYLVSNMQFASRVESLKEREIAYRNLYESHHKLLDDLQTVVMRLDAKLRIKFLNRAWTSLLGFSVEKSVGRLIEDFVWLDENTTLADFKKVLINALTSKTPKCEIELCFRSSKNNKIWTQLKASRSTAIDSSSTLTICLDNITERKHAQKKLEYWAMHDAVTGLYNRHHFELSISLLAQDALDNHQTHGLVYMDLDYFKVVNDTFGHQGGDKVLQEVSLFLYRRVCNSDILCRLGGDEFAVLLKKTSENNIKKFAAEIQRDIRAYNFQLQGQCIHLGCSIGLAVINGDAKKSGEYLKQADIALYIAKKRGRNLIHLYDPLDNENEQMRHNIGWSQRVRDAISDDRILIYFQPVFDLRQDKVSYYEALVRYRTKSGEIVNPVNFIPALESVGEMKTLDRRVIELAINQLQKNPQLQHIAINLSAQAFQDNDLVPFIAFCLQKTGVSGSCLTFELTESASLVDLDITSRVITELHKLGCAFSIDDFGSGFCSFSYLKKLPTDYIKIDGSFVKNLHRDTVDQTLVRSIIKVIQALGKRAVAEYVENKEILDILREMNVDFVQGHHIGYPKPVIELDTIL